MADATQIRITALDQTTAAFRSVQSNISRMTSTLRSIAGPLAAAFSVAAISSFTKSVVNLADRLLDVSIQTGFTVEQLSALGNAAQLNGSNAETLNTGLTRLNRAISEAASGAQEQLKAFQALGISQEDLRKKAPIDIFYQIADAFSSAENGADKTNVAMRLLGRSGAELIPLLNEGSTSLKEFGSTFSTEDAQRASEFNDNIDKLTFSFQKMVMTGITPVLKGLNSLFASMSAGNKILKADTEGLVGTFEAEAGALMEALTPGLQEANKATQEYFETLKEVNKEIAKPKAKLILEDMQESKRVTEELTERNRELVEIYKQTRRPVDILNDSLSRLNVLYKDGLISLDQYLDAQMQVQEAFQNTVPKIEVNDTALKKYRASIGNVQDALQQVAVRGLQSLEDALIGVYSGTLTVKDAFKQMAASIIQDLIRIQIQRSITGPIADALSGLFMGGSQSPAPIVDRSIYPRALGGTVSQGQTYMVGEKGPELFVPGRTGTVVPNNQLGGSGAVVNQTINISTGVSQTVRAEVIGLMPQIMESTKAAVLDAKRRGGAFGKAFA